MKAKKEQEKREHEAKKEQERKEHEEKKQKEKEVRSTALSVRGSEYFP